MMYFLHATWVIIVLRKNTCVYVRGYSEFVQTLDEYSYLKPPLNILHDIILNLRTVYREKKIWSKLLKSNRKGGIYNTHICIYMCVCMFKFNKLCMNIKLMSIFKISLIESGYGILSNFRRVWYISPCTAICRLDKTSYKDTETILPTFQLANLKPSFGWTWFNFDRNWIIICGGDLFSLVYSLQRTHPKC